MLRKINGFSYDETNGLVVKRIEAYQLTKTQRKLFNYFIQHPKITITKQTLMDEVWGRVVTENSIEKTLSKLRNVIEEDPLNPRILVTHHGHGISFEGVVEEIAPNESASFRESTDDMQSSDNKSKAPFFLLILLATVILLSVIWFIYPEKNRNPIQTIQNLRNDQHLLIMPMTFSDDETSSEEQIGLNELIKSTFTSLDNSEQILFDESNKSAQQAMEKYWKIDQDLILMQTSVKKNAEVYDAVMQLSNGMKTIKVVTIKAKNLTDLAKSQVEFVADLHAGVQINTVHMDSSGTEYLQALNLFKNQQYSQSKSLLEKIITKDDKAYQARFLLSNTLFWMSDFKSSIARLEALKRTDYYKQNSAVIEILLADNRASLEQHAKVISDLTEYMSLHTSIDQIKKSKIMILLANANIYTGNATDALKFYKQSIINLNDKLHPKIFALSYFGQAQVANSSSVGDSVYRLFEKSLYYSKLDNNIQYQAATLDAMSALLFFSNQWEKGLKIKRESIALMEIINDNNLSMGTSLGVLASYLIERGLYTEARSVVDRIRDIANKLNSDHLTLIYYHYDTSIELLLHNYEYCQNTLDKGYQLATKTNNFSMLLNNIFLQLELFLVTKNTIRFKLIWEEKNKLLQKPGLDRYQIYMNLYLARYYKEINEKDKAVTLISKVSELAKQSNDLKFLTDAQNVLAELYIQTNPTKALGILNAIEQYNPNPNPYLEIKAKALHAVDRNIEAFSLMTEAKVAYNEAWDTENQLLLEKLQSKLN